MDEKMIFAAIDVGTNAVRLKLAARGGETVYQRRDAIRPGEGVFATGVMSDEVARRLSDVLGDYAHICRFHRAQVRAVATSALREAQNRENVLTRIRRECGIELEIISGEEEARLTCLGALAGAKANARALCIDIGGGSTEVVLARGERPSALWSLRAGTVRLVEDAGGVAAIQPDGRFAEGALEWMRALADEAVAELPTGAAYGLDEGLGCSGTVRALIAFAGGGRATASAERLARALPELAALGVEGRKEIFGGRRADVVVAAAVLLDALVRRLELSSVRAVKRGLRDGLLVDLERRADAAMLASRPLAARYSSSTRMR